MSAPQSFLETALAGAVTEPIAAIMLLTMSPPREP